MENLDAELVREHVGGLEMRLVQLVERQSQALEVGDDAGAARLQVEITGIHEELALVADVVADASPPGKASGAGAVDQRP